jgi:hypothetical protein
MWNFMKIRLVGAELFQADRRTDMTELTVAIANFANAPNNKSNILICMAHSLRFYQRCSDIYRGSNYLMGEGRIFVESYSVNYT